MTFYYDATDDALVGNNLGEFVEIDEDGTVTIDVTAIMDDGRGFDKLKEMSTAVTSAILRHARE